MKQRNEELMVDAVADAKKMLAQGVPQSKVADDLFPEIPVLIRRALVKRVARDLNASTEEILNCQGS